MSALPSVVSVGGLDAGVSDELLRVKLSVMMEWHLYLWKYISAYHILTYVFLTQKYSSRHIHTLPIDIIDRKHYWH